MEITGKDAFKAETRLIRKNTLDEVLIQLHFNERQPKLVKEVPFEFQLKIKKDYPDFQIQRPKSITMNLVKDVPEILQNEVDPPLFIYTAADKKSRVVISGDYISLSDNSYTNWESFSAKFSQFFALFDSLYNIEDFKRLGLRYRNFISRSELGIEDKSWHDLIAAPVLGFYTLNDIFDKTPGDPLENANTIKQLAIGKYKLIFQNGFAEKLNNKERVYYIDTDLYLSDTKFGKGEIKTSLEDLHDCSYPIFRKSITDTLFGALCKQ